MGSRLESSSLNETFDLLNSSVNFSEKEVRRYLIKLDKKRQEFLKKPLLNYFEVGIVEKIDAHEEWVKKRSYFLNKIFWPKIFSSEIVRIQNEHRESHFYWAN